MIEKTLVIGSGFLGSHLIKKLRGYGIITTGTYLHQANDDSIRMDVRDMDSIQNAINKVKPDLIINCSANTQIDFLEKHPTVAYSINSEGAKNIAIISRKYKIRLVHISTDSVFDGNKGMYKEEDSPNPINVYAMSKARAEKLIQENSDDYIVVRTNFYGYDNKNRFFFNWILNKLKENNPIIGFTDVIFTPLEVSNLSEIILDISFKNYCGIIHLSSDEILSKYQFALKVAEIFELNSDLIKMGSVDNHVDFVAKRPKNTSLDNSRLRTLSKIPIISLTEWLTRIRGTI